MNIKRLSIYVLLTGLLIWSCKPQKGKDKDLPAPGAADFTMERQFDPNDPLDNNTYKFTNTTPGAFITSWDFSGISKSKNANETVFFPEKGTYKITLIATSKGGTTTITKDLTIEETSPYAALFDMEPTNEPYKYKLVIKAPNYSDHTFYLPNGDSLKTIDPVVYMPYKGSFNITLKLKTPKGISAKTQTLTVDSDDLSNPLLQDPNYLALTGGLAAANGKTWLLAKVPMSGGAGPYSIKEATYAPAPDGPGGEFNDGMLLNEFTFNIRHNQYIPKNTNVTANWAFANAYFGKKQPQYNDVSLSDPNHKQAPFKIVPSNNGAYGQGYAIDILNGSYLGFFNKRNHYEILKLVDDTLFVRVSYTDNPESDPKVDPDPNAKYFKFVPKK